MGVGTDYNVVAFLEHPGWLFCDFFKKEKKKSSGVPGTRFLVVRYFGSRKRFKLAYTLAHASNAED
jgi:hypothetical protein